MSTMDKWWIEVAITRNSESAKTLVRVYYRPDAKCDVNGVIADEDDWDFDKLEYKCRFPYSAFLNILIKENEKTIIDPDFTSSIKRLAEGKGITFYSTKEAVCGSDESFYLVLNWCYRNASESEVKTLCQNLGNHISGMFNERGFVGVEEPETFDDKGYW